MKSKILEIIGRENDLPITAFKKYMPEIIGDYEFHFQSKYVKKTNILLVSGVNQKFIDTMHELISKKLVMIEVVNHLVFAYDQSEMYDLPLASIEKVKKGYKNLHWLPLLIKKQK